MMKNQKPGKVENGVKGVGTPRCNLSPRRVISRPQGRPDRHQATEAINVKNIRVGRWNVRTLFQSGKLDNVKQEMT